MGIAAKLDGLGRPAWIAVTVLGFLTWWPLGVALLAFTFGSGRMSGCRGGRVDRWYDDGAQVAREGARMAREGARQWFGPRGGSSGNRAFDEYREDTLRRLEEEQREFRSFLERLRMAKDKSEFDAFMAERRRRTVDPEQA